MRQTLTRAAVVTTAREMLEAEGLDGVSLRRIATKLGVTAPALYAYVTDKLDLLQAIAELELEGLLGELAAVRDADPVGRIRRFAELYLGYSLRNPSLFRAIFLFRPELTAEPRHDRPALASRVLEVVEDAVREALDQGRLRAIDPHLATVIIWTSVHGVVTMVLTGPRERNDPNEVLEGALDAVLAGLGTREHAGSSLH
jgi:AcrR family transcriptional regulator